MDGSNRLLLRSTIRYAFIRRFILKKLPNPILRSRADEPPSNLQRDLGQPRNQKRYRLVAAPNLSNKKI